MARLKITDRVSYEVTISVNVDGEVRDFIARLSGKRRAPADLAADFQAGKTNRELVEACGLGVAAWTGDALFVDDADQPLLGESALTALLDFAPSAWAPVVEGYLEANTPKAKLGN